MKESEREILKVYGDDKITVYTEQSGYYDARGRSANRQVAKTMSVAEAMQYEQGMWWMATNEDVVLDYNEDYCCSIRLFEDDDRWMIKEFPKKYLKQLQEKPIKVNFSRSF